MKMSLCLKLDLTLEWLDAGMLERKTVGSDHTGEFNWSSVACTFR
jgi:hypothetical protein